ncbi:MAG TPA: hypothetical protein VFI31_06430 [Pirellulales bacterium]|nr:hypothetical protein [Pirellulales bacterium]
MEPSSLQADAFSLARLLTLLVLLVATIAIALANFSSEPVKCDTVVEFGYRNKSLERAYGWPLPWYWRSKTITIRRTAPAEYSRPHFGFCHNLEPPWTPTSPVLRYSLVRLIANLAVWLAILAAVLTACQWLLRHYRPPLRAKPRPTTLVLLVLLSVLMVLANLSSDTEVEFGATTQHSYGWPCIWYRYIDLAPLQLLRVWDYSTARLAGNLLVCLVALVAAGLVCESLLKRYQPRFRWSLKTMLVGVTLACALCAWCVATRNRADEQDEISLSLIGGVYFERSGPKWLDLLGADRFRRRIVAARVDSPGMHEETFQRLARLPSLRLLDITPWLYDSPFVFTGGMGDALGKMRQLRVLCVDARGKGLTESRTATRECLAAIGRLTYLQRLRLEIYEEAGDSLNCLSGLTDLKALTLVIFPFKADDSDEAENSREAPTLKHLPVLPRLECLVLDEWEIGDESLGQLARFSRLKSLDLAETSASDIGLAKLAPLDSLEELAIDEVIATPNGFKALAALKGLKTVHIAGPAGYRAENQDDTIRRRAEFVFGEVEHEEDLQSATLRLDDGRELLVLSAELSTLHKALAALRRSHPGIVIDARYPEFHARHDLQARWLDSARIGPDMRRLLSKP